jgi:hypothetical protein
MPDYEFKGFRLPTYTMVPDEVFDELLSRVTGNELKVLLYIIRRTMGFRKDADAISLAQFSEGIVKRDGTRLDSGAGVSKRGAVDAVNGLVGKGIIEAETQTGAGGGFAPTLYRLRFQGSAENAQGISRNRIRGDAETNQPLVQKLHTQHTVLQETDNNSGQGAETSGDMPRGDGSPPSAEAIVEQWQRTSSLLRGMGR